jgi:hypothetical protein
MLLSSSNRDASRDIRDSILLERIELLYKNGRYSNLTVLIACAVLTLILLDKVPHSHLFGWLIGMLLGVVLRSGLIVWREHAQGELSDTSRWA